MRNAFVKALEENVTPELMLITGDLGFGVLTNFKDKNPQHYLNAGVAEPNMTGLAAGLALEGHKVFTYSIANFNTLRAVEQIRNDIAYHDLNVIITAVGGGLAYGQLGISHHATEDLAILRSIPNLKVFAPGDTREAYLITQMLIRENHGPVYLRLGRAGEASLHSDESLSQFKIGQILTLHNPVNSDIAIISTGGMLEIADKIHQEFSNSSIPVSVYSAHTIKPFDKSGTIDIFRKHKYVFSVEEHSIIGGLASCISESLIGVAGIIMEHYNAFALPSEFTSVVGDQNYLRNVYNISFEKVIEKIRTIIKL